jgi:tRNA(Phe) wybutosine-synthesizing methylase Tyw3
MERNQAMNISDSYFLTTEQKRTAMRNLSVSIKAGNIDKAMIPHLEEINKMPGLMTQYCCEGHEGDVYNKESGNLIIKLSKEAFNKIILGKTHLYSSFGNISLELYSVCGCRLIVNFDRKNRERMMSELIHKLGCRLGISRFVRLQQAANQACFGRIMKKVPKGKKRAALKNLKAMFYDGVTT